MATLVLALGAWMLSGSSSGASVPAEVDALIDDYLAAWENEDIDALEAVTTGDYMLLEYIYAAGRDIANPDDVSLILHLDRTTKSIRNEFADEFHEGAKWEIERSGSAVVSGDGPWFVSFEEIWSDATISGRLIGVATYTVMDDDGTLRIDKHYWSGFKELGTGQ